MQWLSFSILVVALSSSPKTAEVNFGGSPIIEIVSGSGTISVSDRAEFIEQRLSHLASLDKADYSLLESRLENRGAQILFEENLILLITPEDASLVEMTPEQLAPVVIERLKKALWKHREQNTLENSLRRLGFTLGIIFIYILIIWLTFRFMRHLEAFISRKIVVLLNTWSSKGLSFISTDQLLKMIRSSLLFLKWSLFSIFLYLAISALFGLFPQTASLAPNLLRFVLSPLKVVGNSFIQFVPNFFFIFILVFVAIGITKFIGVFFTAIANEKLVIGGFASEWATTTFNLIRIFVFLVTLVGIFPYLPGSDSPAFKGISVFIGLLLSLGSGSAMSNSISGVVLTYMRAFRVGDWVRVGSTMGSVSEKRLTVTRIRTPKNEDVTIPNSVVMASQIMNFSSFSKTEGVILHTTVTIGYDAPWPKVHALLIAAAQRTKYIHVEPSPFVLQTALNDYHISYEINAYTSTPEKMPQIYSELHQNIQTEFAKSGVEILSPMYNSVRDGNKSTLPQISSS